jgi:hypothetical protein
MNFNVIYQYIIVWMLGKICNQRKWGQWFYTRSLTIGWHCKSGNTFDFSRWLFSINFFSLIFPFASNCKYFSLIRFFLLFFIFILPKAWCTTYNHMLSLSVTRMFVCYLHSGIPIPSTNMIDRFFSPVFL